MKPSNKFLIGLPVCKYFGFCFLFCTLFLSSCTNSKLRAPVVDGWKQKNKQSDYVVKRGDTVYSIAWAFEQDYHELVRWNHLQSPYALYAGQHLKMHGDVEN